MTLTQALKEGNIKLSFDDKLRLSRMINYQAKKKGIQWTKVEETILVNDYPPEYTNEMQQQIINYLKNKK